ncbi:pyridoxal phosphate enzyme, YggS family [Sphaerochaeta pleomorpha str. Grapes]|uniref:Pyridoxal phosphate homeostasis protein n=1 Tax=Sphaerochaeta pleomorpha (strain ATCC BAA-1885 / DSM 22778 / Grapes) TaxID=158190 RepID=G8QVF4_SPHPG|nr:YggS family pyridoxal phosphate-dependent enzyme [Sphaerochaeta pleomorpha]AEV28187.1 pyridoxal phosphate enzyme, YggS family [Sphaerochaeta pleomorpha str. Grapes]
MIRENLMMILEEIETAAKKSGRSLCDISLMAVSKLHPYEEILEAYHCGQRLFGENKVQEVQAKFPSLRPEGMDLHLIGHLQTNKVKKIVGLVDGIDSVDSLKLATKISEEALVLGKAMPILLEFNTSGEENKSGFTSTEELFRVLDVIEGLKGVSLQGLMTIGPLGKNDDTIRKAFRQLKEIQILCRYRYPSLCFETLSMGMSSDFALAIEEGSTVVRVGTRLFGQRDYTK